MVCPYCGKEIERPTREHFFPQSVCSNGWDFWACYSCNKLKREHVVYPATQLFKQWPENFTIAKFKQLWKLSDWDKYLNLVPARRMRQIFDAGKWIDGPICLPSKSACVIIWIMLRRYTNYTISC